MVVVQSFELEDMSELNLIWNVREVTLRLILTDHYAIFSPISQHI